MGEVDYKKIGLFIKENRKRLKLTQKELGEKIGKTESSIRKYEKGLIQIPNDVLEKIAKIFNVDILEILANETVKSIIEPIDRLININKIWNEAVKSSIKPIDRLITIDKIWNEAEKINFPDKSSVESYINSFYFILKINLIDLNFNISDNDKIKILEDLEKYFSFLISKYNKNND